MLKQKREGYGLAMRVFEGEDANSYLVFRTPDGSYHVFVEVEAKQAARECGSTSEGNTRQRWGELWEAKE